MPRPRLTLRTLLVLLLAVGCFFGGIRFERERQRQADEAGHSEGGMIYVMGGYETEVWPDGHQLVRKLPQEPLEIPAHDGQPARLINLTGAR